MADCGCKNLAWVVVAVLAVTILLNTLPALGVELPALDGLTAYLPTPTPEEQAEIDAAVDLSFDMFKDWWWVTTLLVVMLLFGKWVVVLAWVVVDRITSWVVGWSHLSRWVVHVWMVINTVTTILNTIAHGPVHALTSLVVSGIASVVLVVVVNRVFFTKTTLVGGSDG